MRRNYYAVSKKSSNCLLCHIQVCFGHCSSFKVTHTIQTGNIKTFTHKSDNNLSASTDWLHSRFLWMYDIFLRCHVHRCLKILYENISEHYENMPIQIHWNFYHQKKWKISDKNFDIFHISAQNIDCGYSLEQSMFLSRSKKNNVYPCKPQFYYIKVGFKGINII